MYTFVIYKNYHAANFNTSLHINDAKKVVKVVYRLGWTIMSSLSWTKCTVNFPN